MPSNLARKSARRKQQTRLTFDPIDLSLRSSSPANMSPAKVRYQPAHQRATPSSSGNTYIVDEEESEDVLSSSKKSYMMKGKGKGKSKTKADGKLPFKTLPTPVKSSQTIAKENSSFNTIESEDDSTAIHKIRSEHRRAAISKKSTMGPSSRTRRTKPVVDIDDSDGSPPEDEIETPSKPKKGKGKHFSTSPDHNSDGYIDGGLPALPLRRSTRSTKASTTPNSGNHRRQTSIILSSDSDDEIVYPMPEDSQRRKVSKPIKFKSPVDDDEPDDNPLPSSSRRKRRSIVPDDEDESDASTPIVTKLLKSSKSPVNDKSKNQAAQIQDDSDDDVVLTSSTRHHHPSRISVSQEGESDEEPISSPLKKRRRPAAIDSDDSNIQSTPRKRRRQVNEEDDDSDLPSVQDIPSRDRARSRSSTSPTTPNRITRQTKGRKHRTAKEKQMELLKRKRAGEVIEELTDSTEASSEPRRGVYDTDSDLEMLSTFEDESEPEEEREKPRKSTKKTANRDSYHLSDDSDFIVDDDEGPLGVPHLGLLDIPLQFRHAAHKPMKEHFKDAIEWMVHRKINPAFPREDDVYLQAFKKLDDECQGYAKSKFASTQWTAEFTRAIYARPIFIERPCAEGEGYTIEGLPKCDVCNHRKHFPKFAIHFEGKAYYKSTLDEVEKDSEDEDSDDDNASLNSKGQELPPEDKEWFSGAVCRANAQQAHTLIHWKYALNEWVVDQLEIEGYLTPEKLAEREKMKAKKRRDYANSLVDEWERNGVIRSLYGDFKRQLEAARESKQGRWEKGRFVGFSGDD